VVRILAFFLGNPSIINDIYANPVLDAIFSGFYFWFCVFWKLVSIFLENFTICTKINFFINILYFIKQRLWFPTSTSSSADGGGGGAAFSFSLSSAAVVGGPQGSFECVQQCGSRSLESLGVMALKMNVKAKDDVYEATRQRMAVAEEESKKNW